MDITTNAENIAESGSNQPSILSEPYRERRETWSEYTDRIHGKVPEVSPYWSKNIVSFGSWALQDPLRAMSRLTEYIMGNSNSQENRPLSRDQWDKFNDLNYPRLTKFFDQMRASGMSERMIAKKMAPLESTLLSFGLSQEFIDEKFGRTPETKASAYMNNEAERLAYTAQVMGIPYEEARERLKRAEIMGLPASYLLASDKAAEQAKKALPEIRDSLWDATYKRVMQELVNNEEGLMAFDALVNFDMSGEELLKDPRLQTYMLASEMYQPAPLDGGRVHKMIAGGAGLMTQRATGLVHALPYIAGGGLLGASALPIGPATAGAGAWYGYMLGSAIHGFKREMGMTYIDYLRLTDADGNPIDPEAARTAALAYGALSGVVEYIQLATMGGAIKSAFSGMDALRRSALNDSLRKALRSGAFQKHILPQIKEHGMRWLSEAGEEGLQSLIVSYGRNNLKEAIGVEKTPWSEVALAALDEVGQMLNDNALPALFWGTVGGIQSVRIHNSPARARMQETVRSVMQLETQLKNGGINANAVIGKDAWFLPRFVTDMLFEMADEDAKNGKPERANLKERVLADAGLDVSTYETLSGNSEIIMRSDTIEKIKDGLDESTKKIIDEHARRGANGVKVGDFYQQQHDKLMKELADPLFANTEEAQSALKLRDDIIKQAVEAGENSETAEIGAAFLARNALIVAKETGRAVDDVGKIIVQRASDAMEEAARTGNWDGLMQVYRYAEGDRPPMIIGENGERIPLKVDEEEKRAELEQKLARYEDILDENREVLAQRGVDLDERNSKGDLRYWQGEEPTGTPMGSMHIDPTTGAYVITLFKARDASTFAHEAAHIFFENLTLMAESENSSQWVRDAFETVKQFVGWEEGQTAFTREQKEIFADGFLKYLKTRKAPTNALTIAFVKFKSWLTGIINQARIDGMEISDEVMAVYDQMITTPVERSAKLDEATTIREVFTEEMGNHESVNAMRDVLDKLSKSDLPEEAQKAINATRTLLTGKKKLSRDDVVNTLGDSSEIWNALPQDIFADKDGMTLAEAAKLFGYENDIEFIQAISTVRELSPEANQAINDYLDATFDPLDFMDDEQRAAYEEEILKDEELRSLLEEDEMMKLRRGASRHHKRVQGYERVWSTLEETYYAGAQAARAAMRETRDAAIKERKNAEKLLAEIQSHAKKDPTKTLVSLAQKVVTQREDLQKARAKVTKLAKRNKVEAEAATQAFLAEYAAQKAEYDAREALKKYITEATKQRELDRRKIEILERKLDNAKTRIEGLRKQIKDNKEEARQKRKEAVEKAVQRERWDAEWKLITQLVKAEKAKEKAEATQTDQKIMYLFKLQDERIQRAEEVAAAKAHEKAALIEAKERLTNQLSETETKYKGKLDAEKERRKNIAKWGRAQRRLAIRLEREIDRFLAKREIAKEMNKMLAQIKAAKADKGNTILYTTRESIRTLLDNYELRRIGKRAIERRGELEMILSLMPDVDIDTPEALAAFGFKPQDMQRINTTSLSEMTFDEVRQLHAEVMKLAESGKREYQELRLRERTEVKERVDELLSVMGDIAGRPRVITDANDTRKGYSMADAQKDVLRREQAKAIIAMEDDLAERGEQISPEEYAKRVTDLMLQVEQEVNSQPWWLKVGRGARRKGEYIFEQLFSAIGDRHRLMDLLDGGHGTFNGPFYKFFIRRFNRAKDNWVSQIERRSGEAFENKLRELDIRMDDEYAPVVIDDPSVRVFFQGKDPTRAQILGMYLLSKDPEAADAVLNGNANGVFVKKDFIDRCIEELTDAERELGDYMFGILNDPDAFERSKKAWGEATNKLLTKREYYVPMFRQERQSYFASIEDAALAQFVEAKTGVHADIPGFTRDRIPISKKNQTAVELNAFKIFTRHIQEEEHMIAYGKALKEAREVLLMQDDTQRRTGIARAIDEKFGRDMLYALNHLYNDYAQPTIFRAQAAMEGLLGRAIKLKTQMALAYNIAVYFKNLASAGKWFLYANPVDVLSSVYESLTNHEEFSNRVYSLDPQIASRRGNVVVDMMHNSQTDKAKTSFGRAYDRFIRRGMEPNAVLDRWVASVMFDSVYKSEMRRENATPQEAIYTAQEVVQRLMQPVDQLELPDIWRRGGWARIPLMFTSEGAKALNIMLYDMPRQFWGRGTRGQGLRCLAGMVLCSFIMRLVTYGGPDDDEEEAWGDWMMRAITEGTVGSLPIVGEEVMQFVDGTRNFGPKGTILFEPAWSFFSALRDYMTGNEAVKRNGMTRAEEASFALLNLFSMWGRPFPYAQFRRTYSALKSDDWVNMLFAVLGNKKAIREARQNAFNNQ